MLVPLLMGWLLATPAHADDGQTFSCCGRPSVDAVVTAWLDVHDDLAAGRAPADGMKALAEAASGRFPSRERDVAADLARQAARLADGDLASVREGLDGVSRAVVWLALRAEGGAVSVVQVHCPGRGTWLQRAGTAPVSPWGEACAQPR